MILSKSAEYTSENTLMRRFSLIEVCAAGRPEPLLSASEKPVSGISPCTAAPASGMAGNKDSDEIRRVADQPGAVNIQSGEKYGKHCKNGF